MFDRSFLIGIQRYQLRNDCFKPEALPHNVILFLAFGINANYLLGYDEDVKVQENLRTLWLRFYSGKEYFYKDRLNIIAFSARYTRSYMILKSLI
jgi:hypothetical protein